MLGHCVEIRVNVFESGSLRMSGAMSCWRNCALCVHRVPFLALVAHLLDPKPGPAQSRLPSRSRGVPSRIR